MIVYGKNVFTQIQDQPEEIQELYIQDSLKDRKVLDALNRLKHVKVNRVSRAVLDRQRRSPGDRRQSAGYSHGQSGTAHRYSQKK